MPASPSPNSTDRPDSVRLELLFRLYNARLVSLLGRLVNRGDRATAEELAQETWFQLSRCIASMNAPDDQAFGYIAAIARNVVGAHYRLFRNHERPADWTDAVTSMNLPVADSAEDAATADPEVVTLPPEFRELIEDLTPRQRAALLLRLEDGLTFRAVGTHMGVSERTVRRETAAALAAIRPAVLALAG
jgi:RNA polymerase sigma factor (sigma-70 family)